MRRIVFFVLALVVALASGCTMFAVPSAGDVTPAATQAPEETPVPEVTPVPQDTPVETEAPGDTAGEGITLAYVKYIDGVLWVDDVLWINGDDTDALEKYNIDPESVTDDYAIVNEQEGFEEWALSEQVTFSGITYEDGIGNVSMDAAAFQTFMNDKNEWGGILVNVERKDGLVIAVDEVYTP